MARSEDEEWPTGIPCMCLPGSEKPCLSVSLPPCKDAKGGYGRWRLTEPSCQRGRQRHCRCLHLRIARAGMHDAHPPARGRYASARFRSRVRRIAPVRVAPARAPASGGAAILCCTARCGGCCGAALARLERTVRRDRDRQSHHQEETSMHARTVV